MHNTLVSFIPLQSAPDVRPPIKADQRNSVWVKTHTQKHEEIEEAARNKMQVCYGIEIKELVY